jgi:hypothetical protein
LLQTGFLRIGSETLAIDEISAASMPLFGESMRLTCLSPIVATTRREGWRAI